MHWRLGEGIAAGSIALFIALVPYHSAEPELLGRWSLPFVVLLGVVLLIFLLAVAALRRPPLGPIDGGYRPPGSVAMARGLDLGAALWGCGYLVGTLFDPAARARLLAFDLFHSAVPAASFMEWGAVVVVIIGVLVRVWTRIGPRFPVQTAIATALVTLIAVGEGVARWAVAYAPRPTVIPTAASARWDALHVHFNGNLFRDEEHAPFAPPRTDRLVLVGGSDAFGVGLDDPGQRLGEQVASRLEPVTERRWEAVNAGLPQARTPDQIEALRQVLGLHPRVVLVQYTFDDIEYLAPRAWPRAPGEGARNWRERLDPVALLYANSMLFQECYLRWPAFTDRFLQRQVAPTDPYRDPTLLGAHLNDLAQFVRTVGDSGVVVAIIPVDVEIASDPARMARYRAFVASADSAGLPVWGIEPAFHGHGSEELVVGHRFRHPNAFAVGLVADAVVDRLKDRIEEAKGRGGRGVP